MKISVNGRIVEFTGPVAGDGIELSGNAIHVASPVQGILTQLEFNSLPADEQNRGFYIISDSENGESVTGPTSAYSAAEVRIGKWIDGKPLYRKCAAFTSVDGGAWKIVVPSFAADYDALISIRGGMRIESGGVSSVPLPYGNTVMLSLNANGDLMMYASSWPNCPAYVVCEYTKT